MKRNMQEIVEQLEKAQDVIDKLGGWLHADIYLYDNTYKELSLKLNFWGLKQEQALEAKKMLGFKTMKKEYGAGDEDWKAENVTFNEVRECKIIGYRTEHIKAQDREVPIYDCNGNGTEEV